MAQFLKIKLLYSKLFLESTDANDWANVSVDRSLWEEIHRIRAPFVDGEKPTHRYFLQIGSDCIVAIGNPVFGNESKEKKIYMPQWILNQYGLQGEGETHTIEIISEEGFPQATKIVLRVIDSAFYDSDIKKELEQALTRLGVIKKEELLHIPIEGLDEFTVDIYVSELEPANIVLCEGDEVVVEFEEPVDAISDSTGTETETETSPFAVDTAFGPRNPTPFPEEIEETTIPPVPCGNILGSNPNAIPEWRRGLAPPPRH